MERARRRSRRDPGRPSTGTRAATEDGRFGSIAYKQELRFGSTAGVDFGNPDFVALAGAFGMPAWRCESAGDLGRRLRHALSLDVPSVIVLPIDYSVDVAISDELGEETVIRT